MNRPRMVYCDSDGLIFDDPQLAATARLGIHEVVPESDEWISLPEASDVFLLPERNAVGWDEQQSHFRPGPRGYSAVSAFTPPGYIRSHLPSARSQDSSRPLPLWAYGAVAWREDGFCVTAFPIERDPKGDPAGFDEAEIAQRIKLKLDEHPKNRLLRHLANCAQNNNCLAAKNYFLERWEGGLPVSQHCPSSCEGCISRQPEHSPIPPSHARIDFCPTLEEALEAIVPHLNKAPLGMISFGQGCEGEPLCEVDFLEELIIEVRRQTRCGTLHMNTNAYSPDAVRRLARAGLDSIRISLNSAQREFYQLYHKPNGYGFEDVVESSRLAVEEGLFVSVNYLIFPGLTDHESELHAFSRFLEQTGVHMIQWKNLNIDPDVYIAALGLDRLSCSRGVRFALEEIRSRFDRLKFGYFNPPREHFSLSKQPENGQTITNSADSCSG